MIKIRLNNIRSGKFLMRMFYLAWQESSVSGLGFLQDRGEMSEEDVFVNIANHADYPGDGPIGVPEDSLYADYVFGRMMKLGVKNIETHSFEIRKENYNQAYQSFANKYSDTDALLQATAESLEADIYHEQKVGYEVTKS